MVTHWVSFIATINKSYLISLSILCTSESKNVLQNSNFQPDCSKKNCKDVYCYSLNIILKKNSSLMLLMCSIIKPSRDLPNKVWTLISELVNNRKFVYKFISNGQTVDSEHVKIPCIKIPQYFKDKVFLIAFVDNHSHKFYFCWNQDESYIYIFKY